MIRKNTLRHPTDDNLKRCGMCKQFKIRKEDFYKRKDSADGFAYRCKSCNNRVCKVYRENNKEQLNDKRRWRQIETRHGLPKEEWLKIYHSQDKVCAICKLEQKTDSGQDLCVDHDHKSKVVRGLLCNGCNRGLGFFFDSPEFLRRAANYLEEIRS